MTFSLGIYDLLAWLMPGYIYLFMINEYLNSSTSRISQWQTFKMDLHGSDYQLLHSC